ncbi:MAG: hypothetical protein RLZ98_3691 [Pseudomonadota bacterium]
MKHNERHAEDAMGKPAGGTIRKLLTSETDLFRDHLLRLDKESRRMRFAHGVSDGYIERYAQRVPDGGDLCFGLLVEGEVRAAAELRQIGYGWGSDAEAAVSVERCFQNTGVGTLLMGRVIRSARNRFVKRLYMSCLTENRRMQSIARKYEASLRFEPGEVIGEIVPEAASYFSVIEEAMEDRVGFMLAVLDLQERLAKVA